MRQYYTSMRGRTEQSDLGWEVYPEGIREAVELAWKLRKPVYVTGNGIADRADSKRARFIVAHLSELHKAIQAGIDVRGYLHWTLLDDFEWALGYIPKFGLASVSPETYKRVLKRSADVYKEIALANMIPHEYLSRYLQVEESPQPVPPQPPAQEPVVQESAGPAAAVPGLPPSQPQPEPQSGGPQSAEGEPPATDPQT